MGHFSSTSIVGSANNLLTWRFLLFLASSPLPVLPLLPKQRLMPSSLLPLTITWVWHQTARLRLMFSCHRDVLQPLRMFAPQQLLTPRRLNTRRSAKMLSQRSVTALFLVIMALVSVRLMPKLMLSTLDSEDMLPTILPQLLLTLLLTLLRLPSSMLAVRLLPSTVSTTLLSRQSLLRLRLATL